MHTVIRRVARALPALILLIPLTAAQSPGCESEGNSDSGVQGHANTQVKPEQARHATIRVTEATGPYDVWTMAHQVGVAEGDHYRDKRVAAGYVLIVTYTTGLRIEIRTRVSGAPERHVPLHDRGRAGGQAGHLAGCGAGVLYPDDIPVGGHR